VLWPSLVSAPRSAWAANGDASDPGEVWLTETDSGTTPAARRRDAAARALAHDVHAPLSHPLYDEERALAERAAHVVERAHLRLTSYLNWLPSGRIDVTLNDHTDSANGFASSVPLNTCSATARRRVARRAQRLRRLPQLSSPTS